MSVEGAREQLKRSSAQALRQQAAYGCADEQGFGRFPGPTFFPSQEPAGRAVSPKRSSSVSGLRMIAAPTRGCPLCGHPYSGSGGCVYGDAFVSDLLHRRAGDLECVLFLLEVLL